MDILLAIRRNRDLENVGLEKRTKASLADKFSRLHETFLTTDTEIHDYAPAFTPEKGGLVRLKYELPAPLWDCRAALPKSVGPLDVAILQTEGISAIVAVECGKKPRYMFQAIDNRYLVQPSRVAFFFNSAFQFNDSVGISFRDQLDALHQDGYLYFRSELVVRRFLDIEQYFTEATDDELVEFFGGKEFDTVDMDSIKGIANDVLRRKLHGIVTSGRIVTPKTVEGVAKAVGVKVKLKAGKIVVPTTLPEFREFVRILDDAYLESMLDRRSVYLTTSKRKVSG